MIGMYFFAAALAVTASPALASDWKFVTISTDKAVWYADLESVREVTDGYSQKVVRAWIKIDYSDVKSEPNRERKVLFFFKCAEEQAKIVSNVAYRPDGSVASSYSPTYSTYDPVVPDSVLSAAMQLVCSTAGK